MTKPATHPSEQKRLSTLKEYQVLDTPSDRDLDELTKIAAAICKTPIALISLVDECRQWFKSKTGLEANETHRDVAFCSHAILSDSPMIVPNALLDDRFKDNPLVLGPPHVRFYAGVPLQSYSGQNVGTLCVIDHLPRTLESWQLEALKGLARQIVHLFELRALQRSSENRERGFLASIAQNMLEGAVLQDDSGKIVMANPAALHVLALTEDQLLGRTSMDPSWNAIHEGGTQYQGHEHPAMMALATGKAQLLKRMGVTLPSGITRWLQINSNLIYPEGTGRNRYVLSTFADISNEIESSTKIQALSKRNQLILDNIPALVAYWDKSERCQFANQAYVEWFGGTSEQLIGKSMLELLGPILYEKNKNYIQSALCGQRQDFERDLIYKTTGENRHTTAHYIPEIENGQTKGFYVIVFDVTALKRLELRAKEETQNAILASKSKSDFLATISHEIRTPINGVMGMASLLDDTTLDSTQREYTRTIRTSADILLRLVNDILDLSKAEAGKVELENIDFDLSQIVTDVERTLNVTANNKGLKLFRSVSADTPKFLNGDPTRLTQVLVNLATNAIKFTSLGSVTIDASLKSLDGNRVILIFEVSDTGIGLTNEAIKKLFIPFSQADSSTTRKFGGTGLGLSICKHLVNLMGGEIGVRSELGKGSVFWFTIETTIGNMNAVSSMDLAHAQPAIQNLRILVVDDNSTNQLIAVKMLEKLGHNAVAVGNGKEAIEAINLGKYDLVFMDCQMPEMDGYEATRVIRRERRTQFSLIPIIAMTANAMNGDRQKCIDAGMNDYISKPMKIEDLNSVIVRNFTRSKMVA